MSKTAIYAGTFDPFTNGHLDILNRSLSIFDKVVIVIAKSPKKNPLFSAEQRKEMLEELFANNDKVEIDLWEGLIVDYAKNNNITAILRGLRPTGDFEIEFQMASMNQQLLPGIETVFLVTEGQNYYVSSSLVKEVYSHGGDVSSFVPPIILKKLEEKISR